MDGAAAGAERFAELIRQAEQLEAPPQGGDRRQHVESRQCLSESGDHARAIQASEDAINLAQQLYGATHIHVLLERRLTHARRGRIIR